MLHLYQVTMKSGVDIWTVNVFASDIEDAKEQAEIKHDFGRAIKAKRATS